MHFIYNIKHDCDILLPSAGQDRTKTKVKVSEPPPPHYVWLHAPLFFLLCLKIIFLIILYDFFVLSLCRPIFYVPNRRLSA